jgi:uroporphyrinogen decarboxylase
MAEMTSRERVQTVLNHQESDRVPLDIGGGSSTTIVVEGYEKLKDSLGISGETRIMNKVFRLAKLDESVLERLGSDCVPLGLKPPLNWTMPAPPAKDCFVDIWGITWQRIFYGNGCFYWELYQSPLADATVEDIERYPWPDPLDPGYTAGLADEAKELFESTDYAIMADSGFKSLWELGYMLRGLEQMFKDLIANPEFVKALLEKLLEINMTATAKFLDAVGPYIQIFRTADDLAAQQSLLMSPETYRKVLKPFYQRYFDLVRSKTDAKIFYHSCGNITRLIDDLVDMGVDILNPVQVSAMEDTSELKARFGDKVTFWGGIDSQKILPFGSVKEVEEEVKQRIRDLAPGGGFVLAAVHNIQPDVPLENILAMADSARKFGNYPIAC